jgi:hypothetical protein
MNVDSTFIDFALGGGGPQVIEALSADGHGVLHPYADAVPVPVRRPCP